MRNSLEPTSAEASFAEAGFMEPGVMVGTIRHRRFLPASHEFSYPLFMSLLDIDQLPQQMEVSTFASLGRWNILSFYQEDYLAPGAGSLRERLAREAGNAGFPLPEGRILLLTHPRFCGYGFNPISLFYCFDLDGHLQQVGAEVHSTFGERHLYWLGHWNRDEHGCFHCAKQLHVSPFMTMDHTYRFGLAQSQRHLTLHIDNWRAGERLFDATLSLDWRPWTRSHLESALLEYPFMTAKVTAAIHWQALKLYLKRIPFIPHPSKSNPRSFESR